MRRNLTLEETGVLDLRQFLDSNEKWNEWSNNYTIFIPVDWLVAQGFKHLEASWSDEHPEMWFISKFHNFILSHPEDSNNILYGFADDGSTYIAHGEDSFNLISDGILDGEFFILEYEEY